MILICSSNGPCWPYTEVVSHLFLEPRDVRLNSRILTDDHAVSEVVRVVFIRVDGAKESAQAKIGDRQLVLRRDPFLLLLSLESFLNSVEPVRQICSHVSGLEREKCVAVLSGGSDLLSSRSLALEGAKFRHCITD